MWARRITSFLLLLLLLFCAGGYLLVFKVQQYAVRKEIKMRIKAGVPKEDLVLLKIPRQLEEQPSAEFQRIHSREFRYRGMMYDIVRQEAKGDTTYYYCVTDTQETVLFAELDKMVEKSLNTNPDKSKHTQTLEQVLRGLYYQAPAQFLPLHLLANRQLPTPYFFSEKNWVSPHAGPPPRA